VVEKLRAHLEIVQTAVLHNELSDGVTLVIWYVDLDLDPGAPSSRIEEDRNEALARAVRVAHAAVRSDDCVKQLFDKLNLIVVDSQYAGWFSASVALRHIPATEDITEADLENIVQQLEIGYSIESHPTDPPISSCTWWEARQAIKQHFSPDRTNVEFYFVVDRTGRNLWAQWDGPSDPAIVITNLLNIQLELDCFDPSVNIIFTIVNEAGQVTLAGWVPEGDLGQAQILYQR
jgi:hypothetical protein